jgi:hypothetical protein
VLLVCSRHGYEPLSHREITALDARLRPDNLAPRTPRVRRERGVVSVVFNPPERVEARGASVCVGALCGGSDAWNQAGGASPDGSFALLRADERMVELVADAVASRTVWYVLTEELFVASTSQRAVASVLGSFEPDRRAFAWMLSSGSLGPGFGWDARVRSVPIGGRVRLDRTNWRLAIDEPSIGLGSGSSREPWSLPRSGLPKLRGAGPRHQRRLDGALEQAFAGYAFDPGRWILPLSGGVDSRGILLFLNDATHFRGTPFRSVTWGVERSLDDPRSDGRIAERLADRFGLEHRFLPISVSGEPRERLIDRFLVAGEGRTDRLSGYLDGFEIWRIFAEQGCEGVIRGDEAFGWNAVRDEADVLRECGVTRLGDVLDERSRAAFALPEQPLPSALERRARESLASWRDRLYQQFRLPVLLAALTDLKCAYVEVTNPLLSSSIIECVRTLPDRLRTDKRLWRRIVTQRSPAIPFAARTGVYPLRDFVREPATLELMLEELGSDSAHDVLGQELARSLRADAERMHTHALTHSEGRAGPHERGRSVFGPNGLAYSTAARVGMRVGGRAARIIGRCARAVSPAARKHTIEREILAFRAFLIVRAVAMLRGDAGAFEGSEIESPRSGASRSPAPGRARLRSGSDWL